MTPPRRWSFRFTLSTLFVVVTLATIAAATAPTAWKKYQRWASNRRWAAEEARNVRELEAYQVKYEVFVQEPSKACWRKEAPPATQADRPTD